MFLNILFFLDTMPKFQSPITLELYGVRSNISISLGLLHLKLLSKEHIAHAGIYGRRCVHEFDRRENTWGFMCQFKDGHFVISSLFFLDNYIIKSFMDLRHKKSSFRPLTVCNAWVLPVDVWLKK